MPAQIPDSLLPPSILTTLRLMPVGAEYTFDRDALLVDRDGSCYLYPEAQIAQPHPLRVRRDEDGYHVTVVNADKPWTPRRIPEVVKPDLIPVATIRDATRL